MEPEGITFPAEYPIKVIARSAAGLKDQTDAVFAGFYGPVPEQQISLKPSAEGRFVSLTYTVRAESEDQLKALFLALKQIEGVLMVL